MRAPLIALLAALLATCAALPAHAAAPPQIEITAAGRYVTELTGEVAHPAGRGNTDEVQATEGSRFIEQGTQLTVHYCDSVGIRFRAPGIRPSRPVPITIEILHPPVPFPNGPHTHDTWNTTVDSRPRSLGVRFEEAAMMQPGTWTINVRQNNRTLATQRFELTIPANLGPEPDDCTPKVS